MPTSSKFKSCTARKISIFTICTICFLFGVILVFCKSYWYANSRRPVDCGRPNDSPKTSTTIQEWEVCSGELRLAQNDRRITEYLLAHHLTGPPSEDPVSDTNGKSSPATEDHIKSIVQFIQNKLGKDHRGVFLEVGANDGVNFSRTHMLEVDHGWTGLLMEDDPNVFESLRAQKRKTWITNVCAASTPYPQKIRKSYNWHEFITNYRRIKHRIRWGVALIAYENHVFEAQCFPIFSLMSALNVTVVDYMSFDAGLHHKIDILKTIPLDSVTIKIISIDFERNVRNEEKKIRAYLKGQGYSHDFKYVSSRKTDLFTKIS